MKLYAKAIYWYKFFFLFSLMSFLNRSIWLHTKTIAGNILHEDITILLFGLLQLLAQLY